MAGRRDAAPALAELVLAVEARAADAGRGGDGRPDRRPAGRGEHRPGRGRGLARRAPRRGRGARGGGARRSASGRGAIAAARGLAVAWQDVHRARRAERRRRAHRRRWPRRRPRSRAPTSRLLSGAGHDAMVLGRLHRRGDAVRPLPRRREPPPRRARRPRPTPASRSRCCDALRRGARTRERRDLLVRGDVVRPTARRDDVPPGGPLAQSAPSWPAAAPRRSTPRGCSCCPACVDAHVHLNDPGRARLGGLRDRHRRAGRRRRRRARSTCRSTRSRRRSTARPSTPRSRPPRAWRASTSRSGAASCPATAGPARRAGRARRRRLQGVHVGQRGRGVRGGRRPDAVARGWRARPRSGLPGGRPRRERRSSRGASPPAPWPTGASACATTSPRGPSSPSSRRSAARSHFAGETGCALHVVHVSSGRGVALVAEARARGVDVTCETCPHYLVLDDEDAERLGAAAKCAPPLRPAAEREALWAALRAGDVDLVATDHSPAPADAQGGRRLLRRLGRDRRRPDAAGAAPRRRASRRPRCAAALAGLRRRAGALRAGPGQGRARAGRRRRPRAARPGGDWTAAARRAARPPSPEPVRGPDAAGRVVRTILRGRTVSPTGGRWASRRAAWCAAGRKMSP